MALRKIDVGKISELIIAAELQKRGFTVSMPIAEAIPYDLVAERNGICLKVQVKATDKLSKDRGAFEIKSAKNKGLNAYGTQDCDVLICHCISISGFYIIDISSIIDIRKIRLYPTEPHRGSFEDCYENWELMYEKTKL
jgi:hypothetical protein